MAKFTNWEMRKMLEEVGLSPRDITPEVQEVAFDALMKTTTHDRAVKRLFRTLKRRGYPVSLNAKQGEGQ